MLFSVLIKPCWQQRRFGGEESGSGVMDAWMDGWMNGGEVGELGGVTKG